MKRSMSVLGAGTASILVALALSVSVATRVQAQNIEFSGGVNFAKISGEAVQNAARNLGANFGVAFVIPIGPIGLNLGGDYSQKGVEQAVGTSREIIDLSYIEIPVHLRFRLVGAGPVRLNLILGPTLGINTGCNIKIDQAAAEACADIVDGFDPKKIDWSGAAGLGVSFAVGGLAYTGVDLKYTLGLTSVSQEVAESVKNRAFALQAHLGFGLF
jgi:hypothetical protein